MYTPEQVRELALSLTLEELANWYKKHNKKPRSGNSDYRKPGCCALPWLREKMGIGCNASEVDVMSFDCIGKASVWDQFTRGFDHGFSGFDNRPDYSGPVYDHMYNIGSDIRKAVENL